MPIGNVGKNFTEYQDQLGKLVNIINKNYDDVLDGTIGEDDLWITIRQVREKITEGKDFITNKRDIQDLENIVINLATLKGSFRGALDLGDESEQRKLRNSFLTYSQRFITTLSELSNSLKKESRIPSINPPDEIPSINPPDEIPSINPPDEIPSINPTDEIPSINPPDEIPSIHPPDEIPSINPPDEISQNVGKKAIVIGVNKYKSLPDSKNLKGAENDANEIYYILKKNGFEIKENDFLVGEKVDYRAICKSINDAFRKPVNYGTILFYFSGSWFFGRKQRCVYRAI